jgi:uncharacterized integral membrane protein
MLRTLLVAGSAVLLAVIAAIFAALNPGRITLDLAFVAVETERYVALIVALAIGWLIGLLCAVAGIRRQAAEHRRLQRALRLAEQEVEALRSIPVHDAD